MLQAGLWSWPTRLFHGTSYSRDFRHYAAVYTEPELKNQYPICFGLFGYLYIMVSACLEISDLSLSEMERGKRVL